MTLEAQKKLNAAIFRLLKVSEIVIPIGRTNKGNLGLHFIADKDDYEIMLDSVPLSTSDILKDDNNIELKRLIEKYWWEKERIESKAEKMTNEWVENILENNPLPKKGGRPKGSKNGTRTNKKTA